MKSTKESLADLQKFRTMFSALSNFMDDKETLKSMQQAEAEADTRLKDKRAEEAQVDKRLAAVTAKEKAADGIIQDAQLKADDIRDNVVVERHTLLEQASKDAAVVIQKAKDEADNILLPVIQQRDELQAEVEALTTQRDAMNAELLSKQEVHEQLQAKVTETRATIANLLQQ